MRTSSMVACDALVQLRLGCSELCLLLHAHVVHGRLRCPGPAPPWLFRTLPSPSCARRPWSPAMPWSSSALAVPNSAFSFMRTSSMVACDALVQLRLGCSELCLLLHAHVV